MRERAKRASVEVVGVLALAVGWAMLPAQAQDDGPVVLSTGHVDAFEVSRDGRELVLMLKDDTVFGETVFHDPADVILQAVPESEWVVPDWVADFPEWGFLGEPGDIVYRLPDTQNPGLLWPGVSTERLDAADFDGLVELAITDVDGPGALKLYTIDDFGGVGAVLVDSANPEIGDTWEVFAGSHAHYNWVFTEAGTYTLTTRARATLADGTPVVSRQVDYTFVVGELPGNRDGISQSIVTTIDEQDGALVISVDPDDRTVVMPAAELNAAGDRVTSSGQLRPVTVTDTRPGAPGWSASGQVTDFTGDTGSFGGRFLGWTPQVLSQSGGQQVTPGETVSAGFNSGNGLSVSRTLGVAPDGASHGTARLGAELTVELPTETPAGVYTATLTLTAI